jgi:hypothetical protein
MEALMKLFAMAWIAEKRSWENLERYEKFLLDLGREPMTHPYYKGLLDLWSESETETKRIGKELLKAYSETQGSESFSVLSAK